MKYFLHTDEKLGNGTRVQALAKEDEKLKAKRDHKREMQHVTFLLNHDHPVPSGPTAIKNNYSAEVEVSDLGLKKKSNHAGFKHECESNALISYITGAGIGVEDSIYLQEIKPDNQTLSMDSILWQLLSVPMPELYSEAQLIKRNLISIQKMKV